MTLHSYANTSKDKWVQNATLYEVCWRLESHSLHQETVLNDLKWIQDNNMNILDEFIKDGLRNKTIQNATLYEDVDYGKAIESITKPWLMS